MTRTARQDQSPAVDPVDAFTLRAEARAYLVEIGELAFLDAVDGLQQAAIASGLVDEYGQDEIQRILAAAFAVRRP